MSVPAAVKPFMLPRISLKEAEALRQNNARHSPVPLVEGFVLHDGRQPWSGAWVCYEGHVGHEPFRVFLVPPCVALMAARAGVEERAISSDIKAITSLLFLEGCFFWLEQRLGAEIRFSRIGQAVPLAEARYAVIEADGRNWPVAVQATPACLARLLALWPVLPLPDHAVSLSLAVRIGTTTLPLSVLSSLNAGDVVLLEQGSPAQAMVLVEQAAYARAHWAEAQGWVLESAIIYPDKKERPMPDTVHERNSGGAQAITGEATSEDALPITISFEMGQQTITLAELRALGPGSVLVGTDPVKAPVRLCVGGQPIGVGELVDVEGTAGVRVMRIFGRE
ncbi:type III secretion system cytoplasmic ring protein SctQ [Acetobacter cibinongensis]|uniref:Flagellar motor switch protein FliN-like C-terminal domain-containing protein n=1 Tax=Acetobacter cibinongensis TaxID=146475 RepID=A0A1Z5YWQ3_9PROT|nr:type III secretion system cytoplasmic ring protein SctQ [Acetobacter cibinongensis]OUJ03603.1 hypothetical protein HK14_01350 [Acetobacter cibinongensis]